eukprot:4311798-Alexandrium_andersonii.AAC.1
MRRWSLSKAVAPQRRSQLGSRPRCHLKSLRRRCRKTDEFAWAAQAFTGPNNCSSQAPMRTS